MTPTSREYQSRPPAYSVSLACPALYWCLRILGLWLSSQCNLHLHLHMLAPVHLEQYQYLRVVCVIPM